MGRDQSEYETIHGLYWYIEDFLSHLKDTKGDSITYSVRCKDTGFREKHRAVKQLLAGYAEGDLLKREEVFKFYMNTHGQVKITN